MLWHLRHQQSNSGSLFFYFPVANSHFGNTEVGEGCLVLSGKLCRSGELTTLKTPVLSFDISPVIIFGNCTLCTRFYFRSTGIKNVIWFLSLFSVCPTLPFSQEVLHDLQWGVEDGRGARSEGEVNMSLNAIRYVRGERERGRVEWEGWECLRSRWEWEGEERDGVGGGERLRSKGEGVDRVYISPHKFEISSCKRPTSLVLH